MRSEDERVQENAQKDEQWGEQVQDGSVCYDHSSPERLDNEIAERETGIGGYDTERVGHEAKELEDGRVSRGRWRWGCSEFIMQHGYCTRLQHIRVGCHCFLDVPERPGGPWVN